ncbi:MAG TPA: hypothetical protein VFR90_15530 [Methylibium sp.]|uniref:hypothetical protein n=1 Tax=Methylibium sp. TaxID=2067992 RepID=UPI002DB68554|nr:hypothetical protein [Methylibium sp.]HEU4460531.1 hypothetical protein [Methylibium sp.]
MKIMQTAMGLARSKLLKMFAIGISMWTALGSIPAQANLTNSCNNTHCASNQARDKDKHYAYVNMNNLHVTPRSVRIINSDGGGSRCYVLGRDYSGRELKTQFKVRDGFLFDVSAYKDSNNCGGGKRWWIHSTPSFDKNKYWYVFMNNRQWVMGN